MIQARQQASGLQNICLTHILPLRYEETFR